MIVGRSTLTMISSASGKNFNQTITIKYPAES